jgi:hypothetical protein
LWFSKHVRKIPSDVEPRNFGRTHSSKEPLRKAVFCAQIDNAMSDSNNSPQREPTQVICDEITLPSHGETTLADVKQLGLWAAIASLGYVFWVVGGMEMVERARLLRRPRRGDAVCDAARIDGWTRSNDGDLRLAVAFVEPGPVAHSDFHRWSSDRYGYKQTIFSSTILKSIGYLVMA